MSVCIIGETKNFYTKWICNRLSCSITLMFLDTNICRTSFGGIFLFFPLINIHIYKLCRKPSYPHLRNRDIQGVEFTEISCAKGEAGWSWWDGITRRCKGFSDTASWANEGLEFGSLGKGNFHHLNIYFLCCKEHLTKRTWNILCLLLPTLPDNTCN